MTIPGGFRRTGASRCIDIGRDRCATILLVLKGGWERALTQPRVQPGAEEEEITECLRDGMRMALREDVVKDGRRIAVLPGTESRSGPDVPKPDGRTDIPVFFNRIHELLGEHDPHAIIECKRVAGNHASLCRLYVVEGIDRFAKGKYAGNHVVGFMTGYLVSGDAAAAVSRINRYLTGRKRPSEHLGPSCILDEPWTRSSRHPRPTPLVSIDIHHVFFGFQASLP